VPVTLCLPPCTSPSQPEALVLHDRLAALRPNAVLGTSAHLLFALLLEPPFAIFEWKAYADLLRCMSADHRWGVGAGGLMGRV
jgi:hypothetical protein